MQDVEVKPGVLNITNYGLGARGVDIGSTNGDVWYPVYDGHGNMVATLSKSGSGYNVSNRRSYDPWGNLRLGSIYTEPTGRYCANLGHKTDDESAMIYMRARYYEPSVGRFISEDPSQEGRNWTVYCGNNPVYLADSSGKSAHFVAAFILAILSGLLDVWHPKSPSEQAMKNFVQATLQAVGFIELAVGCLATDPKYASAPAVIGGVSLFISAVLLTLALRQLAFYALLCVDEDSGMSMPEGLEGLVDSQWDVNPAKDRSL